jgi:hypothetical protein
VRSHPPSLNNKKEMHVVMSNLLRSLNRIMAHGRLLDRSRVARPVCGSDTCDWVGLPRWVIITRRSTGKQGQMPDRHVWSRLHEPPNNRQSEVLQWFSLGDLANGRRGNPRLKDVEACTSMERYRRKHVSLHDLAPHPTRPDLATPNDQKVVSLSPLQRPHLVRPHPPSRLGVL